MRHSTYCGFVADTLDISAQLEARTMHPTKALQYFRVIQIGLRRCARTKEVVEMLDHIDECIAGAERVIANTT